MPEPDHSHPTTDRRLRLAVAQTTHRQDPYDRRGFRLAGEEVRALMREAHDAGADLIQFCEAVLCFPDKNALSHDPDRLTEADWSRYPWDVLDAEIALIRATARSLRLWTVFGTQRRAAASPVAKRPTTSLLVVSSAGRVVSCYDERALSRSKRSYLYEAGGVASTVDVNGFRLGLASGLEVLFPGLFADYEADDVDAVLFSTAGAPDPSEGDNLVLSARTHAVQNGLWIGYAIASDKAPSTPAGVLDPAGRWTARCPARAVPAVVIADLTARPASAGRAWRRDTLETLRDDRR